MSFINPFCILLCPYLVSEPAKCLLTQYETRGRRARLRNSSFLCHGLWLFQQQVNWEDQWVQIRDSPTPCLPGGAQQMPVCEEEKRKELLGVQKKGICWTSGSDTETVEAPHHQVGSDKRGCLRRLLWKVKKATWYAFRKETPPNDINVRCILGWKYLWCNLSLILPFFKHLLHPLLNISFPSSEAPSPKCQLNLY